MSTPLPPHRVISAGTGFGWVPVHLGKSTSAVYRSSDGTLHAKCAPADAVAELAEERDKTRWLSRTGIPCPEVVDWLETAEGAVLITTTVPGVPASDVPPRLVPRAVDALAEALRALHELPVDKCPWVRRLEVTVSAAERAVATGSVDVDDFDEPRRGRQPSDLLAELRWHQADAQRLEQNDVVVCHGDACLPNLFVSTDAANCTGMLDLSRLGVADRYLDLALITRSMAAKRLNSQYDAAHADRLLRRYGIRAPDEQRLTFYRLLDEFF